MPSKSKAQHNFMEAVAHSPEFAKKAGVPQSVGKEFSTADKGKKFSKGGRMATKSVKPTPMGKVTAGGHRKFGEHTVQEKGHTRGKNVGDSGKSVGIQTGAKRGKK